MGRMIVTWASIRSKRTPAYSQPEPDVLAVMGAELDFSDKTKVNYELPESDDKKWGWVRDYVQRAWREKGVLHLHLLAHTREALFADRTVNYGKRKGLRWND